MRLLTNKDLNQELWDSSLLAQPAPHFLQSWVWGDFQQSLDNPVWRFAVEENAEIVLQLQVIKLSLGLGQSIIYAPRGQLINKQRSAQTIERAAQMLVKAVRDLAKEERCLLFRIDPPTLHDEIIANAFYRGLGLQPNPSKTIQPQHNHIIDLSFGTDAVLASAKPKTRYNINLAKRYESGSELLISNLATQPEVEAFIRLVEKTGSRQGFTTHQRNYIEREVQLLTQSGMAELISAKAVLNVGDLEAYDHWIASILIVYFGTSATYVHGGSDPAHRHLMAPYLLHFTAIKNAAQRGMTYYDMGGVHPDQGHKWAGITRFKEGFGGTTVKYVGSLELPINPLLYKLYRFLDRIR